MLAQVHEVEALPVHGVGSHWLVAVVQPYQAGQVAVVPVPHWLTVHYMGSDETPLELARQVYPLVQTFADASQIWHVPTVGALVAVTMQLVLLAKHGLALS